MYATKFQCLPPPNEDCLKVSPFLRKVLSPGSTVVTVNKQLREKDGFQVGAHSLAGHVKHCLPYSQCTMATIAMWITAAHHPCSFHSIYTVHTTLAKSRMNQKLRRCMGNSLGKEDHWRAAAAVQELEADLQ